ncbi:MAG: ABC transporter permease [Methanothrix sp.]|nr:ABC transporter permease [Methanothrix sp.]
MNQFNIRRIYAVALRVVRQLKRDRRTIGLITFLPIFLMVLFGYALSGEMSGINLGLVESGGHNSQMSYLEGVKDFNLIHLGSESDAEKQILDGKLKGAVIDLPGEIRVLLDASTPQIANAIMAYVNAGMGGDEQHKSGVRVGSAVDDGLAKKTTKGPRIAQRYIYGYDLQTMDSVGPAVVGLVVFFFTFILAAISFLRERTQGTLEKFMVSPMNNLEMVSGYLVGFSLFAFVQSATTLLVVVFLFGVPMQGNPLIAFLTILLIGVVATVLGAFFSNFAKTEFQVVQFIPLVILPQVVLTGVWWPLESIPEFIRPISYLLPLTYSNDALRMLMLKGASIVDILYPDLVALGLFFLLVFAATINMIKRKVD